MTHLTIPHHLLPHERHFGCGPSAINPEHITALANSPLLGTSHRQAPVKDLVGSVRSRLKELFNAPAGYEIALGNGGTTAFWAMATTSLINQRASHATFGEFGEKFANETIRAPHLRPSLVSAAAPGGLCTVKTEADIDAYAWPQHETSTGVLSPVFRPTTAAKESLILIDATSISGGIEVDLENTDAYYFAPQKCFGSEGGLWLAFLSPAAQDRAHTLAKATDRWMPEILDLSIALTNSIKDQTLNTPAIATLVLLEAQLKWMEELGGLNACASRTRDTSAVLYQWAETRSWANPFVEVKEHRSPVVVTIDFTDVDASAIAQTLRANGVVDVEPYRKLGRNQLRIATFPTISPADAEALTSCIDWIVEHQ